MKTKLKSILAVALCAVGLSAAGYTGIEDVTIAVGETITKTIDNDFPYDPSQMIWVATPGDNVTVKLNPSRYTGKPFELQITGLAVGRVTVELQGGISSAVRFYVTVVPPPPVEYLDWDDVEKKMTNAVCDVYEVVTNGMATFEAGKTYVVLNNVTNTTSRITVNGTVANPTRLILCDGAELVAKKGIEVKVNGATTNALTICGQEGGTGALESVFATAMAAGIGGGGYEVAGGIVTINGGTVTATGSDAATGIGGGTEGAGGIVTINGGSVTATGGTGFGAGRSAGTLDPGTVTFGEGVLFSVVTGKTAAVTAPIAQEDYEKDHSAAYVHIAPAKQEISAVSAEGFLDLTVGDRVAEAEEPIVADPKWGNGKKAFVKIDGEDPAREYPELSIDKWFTSALTAGRYGMTFTSGDTNETAVFWKTGDDWVVQDLPPSSGEGVFFESGKTHLILGTTTFTGDAPLEVEDGAKFEYGEGAGFKGGKLKAPRRYRKEVVEGDLYRIVEAIKGCADNPWVAGGDGKEPPENVVEAYTNGNELVIVGAGMITDLSEIPADVKGGIAAITVAEVTVKGAADGVFTGFSNIALTLPENWQGKLPEKSAWYGATGVTLTAYPKAVKNVKVLQRYPWNGLVDIKFALTGEGSVKVTVQVTVDGKKLANPTVTGETAFDLGAGDELKDLKLIWDAKADFGDEALHEKVKVKLTVSPTEPD